MSSSKSKSFLIEDLLDQCSARETALARAAQISSYVTSVTLGPNCLDSSFRNSEEPTLRVVIHNSPMAANPRRVVTYYNSTTSAEDLQCMQQKLRQQTMDRRVKGEVHKKLEERLTREKEHNKKVHEQLELMKLEAERKHRAKVEELQRQIESALKLEEQDEIKYQKQRAEMTKNTRKILEQQEKELREALNKLDDHFNKLDQKFSKIVKNCNPEMMATIDFCKSQFEELKSFKGANPSSLEILKNASVKGEEICHCLLKAVKDFELKKEARQNEEKAKKAAAAELAQAQLLAQAASRAQVNSLQEQEQPVAAAEEPQARLPPTQQSELEVYYNQLVQFGNDKHNATRQLSESPELEGLRFALKLAVNKPINLLNESDPTKLQQSFRDLQDLLMGQRVGTVKGAVSITDHPEACDWTKQRLAEKLVDVCDKRTATVFHVAALAVALCQTFPDFSTFLIAQLMKECPFLVPFKPQLRGQSDNDFLRSCGYRVDNETLEPYSRYQSRTTNFVGFLAAMWITTSRRGEQSPNPFSIQDGWKYLANVLNSAPDPTYCHLIEKLLEVSGASLQSSYGQQLTKLMTTLRDLYLPLVERNVDDEMIAAIDRLRNTITRFFSEKRFSQPSGKLMPNYW